jgi:hypothetical protein
MTDHETAPAPVAQLASAERSGPTSRAPSLSGQLAQLAFDIGAPVLLYYVLHAAGVSSLAALSVSAVLPAASACYKLAVRRQVDPVALVVLGTITVSIVVSLIAHNPRFLLARDGLVTALWGLWFYATLAARRPAAFLFARPFMQGRKLFGTLPWDSLWDTSARFRTIWRTSTVIWGTALLIDAALRVAMAYLLPISMVPALGGALWPVTFVAIQIITNVYYHLAGLYRILGARWISPG